MLYLFNLITMGSKALKIPKKNCRVIFHFIEIHFIYNSFVCLCVFCKVNTCLRSALCAQILNKFHVQQSQAQIDIHLTFT